AVGILGLGVSFRRAPVELLKRVAFDDADLTKAYRHAQDLDGLDEVVILSTCNRVEAYGNVPSYHSGFLALKRVLVETRGIGYEELTDPLYAHWERDATDHLFSVAAGLDSMVLGETQIQRQVREALRRAEAEGAAGPALATVFHAAVRQGRLPPPRRHVPPGPTQCPAARGRRPIKTRGAEVSPRRQRAGAVPRPSGARRRDGTGRRRRIIRCSIRTDACGSPRAFP